MLEFKQTVYNVDVYGEKVDIRKPTGLEKKAWLAKIEKLQEESVESGKYDVDKDNAYTLELIELLGMKKETFNKLEEDHQMELLNTVMNGKKS